MPCSRTRARLSHNRGDKLPRTSPTEFLTPAGGFIARQRLTIAGRIEKMALAFTVIKRSGGGPFSRGIRRVFVEITGETSYVTGGTAIAASDVGLKGAILAVY